MANPDSLTVKQGSQYRSADETWPYTIDTSNWSTTTPSSATGALFDITTDKLDVTATGLTGSSTISTTNITTEDFASMTAGHIYRYECQFVISSKVYEFRIPIIVEF